MYNIYNYPYNYLILNIYPIVVDRKTSTIVSLYLPSFPAFSKCLCHAVKGIFYTLRI